MTHENTATFATANEKAKLPSNIDEFAEAYRLRVSRDECGDPIIRGRRGHLYFDGPKLCAMFVDAPVMAKKRLAGRGPGRRALDGRHQPRWRWPAGEDVEIKGIAPDQHRAAIRLVGARPKRVLSEAQKAVLEKARAASPLLRGRVPGPY